MANEEFSRLRSQQTRTALGQDTYQELCRRLMEAVGALDFAVRCFMATAPFIQVVPPPRHA